MPARPKPTTRSRPDKPAAPESSPEATPWPEPPPPPRLAEARKFQVFVSSTYIDLVDERRAVTEVILGMGHIPVGMELFEAGNEDQWSYIRNRIQEVDYYLLIMAERYGSTGPAGLSYTEMEYRHAVEQGVPVAALLLDEARRDHWPVGKIDVENRKKLNAFRALCQTRMVSYWTDTGVLTTRCQLALSGLIRRHPRAGWVSGEQAVSPQMVAELARLSGENADLRARLASLEREGTAGKELDVTVARLLEPFRTQVQRAARRYPDGPYEPMLRSPAVVRMLGACSLFDMILTRPEEFLDGCTVDEADRRMVAYVREKMAAIEAPRDDFFATVAGPLVSAMQMLMRAWRVVETYLVERPQKPPEKWMRLSPLGRLAFDQALGRFLDSADAEP